MGGMNGVRVVVIGAGLSGLVAARDLAQQGAIVDVVEARNRIGGRVWTLRDAPIAPFHVEAGGEFIDGGHMAIRELARALGLSLVRVLREGFGLALRNPRGVRVHRMQSRVWQGFRRAFAPVSAHLQAVERNWNTSIAAAIARQSLDELLVSRKAPADVRAMAEALRGFFLADSNQLSALVGAELALENVDPGHVPIYRIRGGNDRLALALVKGVDLRLSGRHIVKSLRQSAGHVRVAVEGPNGMLESLHGDYAVVTVPPSVLLSLNFEPRLPDDLRHAVETISFGAATKAVFRFAARWWRGHPRAFGTNLPIGAVWETAEEQRGSALLTFLAGGTASSALQDLLAREGADGVLQQARWLGKPNAVEAVEQVVWDRDPWTRGGYAYFSPSFAPHLRDVLSRAFGRVLFAGDHTSRNYQGYMNGAVESGQRVTQELMALEAIRAQTGG